MVKLYALPIHSNNINNGDKEIIEKRYCLLKKVENLLKILLINENFNETKLSFYSSLNNFSDNNNKNNSNNNNNNSNKNEENEENEEFYVKLKIIFWDRFGLYTNNSTSKKHESKSILIELLNIIVEKESLEFYKAFIEILNLNDNKFNESNWFIDFFNNNENRIKDWFDHFLNFNSNSNSNSENNNNNNRYGSLALERFILSDRYDCWSLLYWSTSRSHPPCVVIQKKELLSQLDIVKTIHSIIDKKPEFFETQHFKQSILTNSKEFLNLDKSYIIKKFFKIIKNIDINSNNKNRDLLTKIINNLLWKFSNNNNNNNHNNRKYLLVNQFYNKLNQKELLSICTTNYNNNNYNNNNIEILNKIVISECNWLSFDDMILFNSLTPNYINRLINLIIKSKKKQEEEQLKGFQEFKLNLDKLLSIDKNDTIINNIESHSLLANFILNENKKEKLSLTTEKIKLILIESFIFFYTLKVQLLILNSKQDLIDYFNIYQIPITIIDNNNNNNDNNNDNNNLKQYENEYPLLNSDDDDDGDDDDDSNKKKRKKSKDKNKKKKKKKYKPSLFDPHQDDESYTFTKKSKINNSGGGEINNLNNLQFKFESFNYNIDEIPQLLYNIKIKEMILFYLNK
ncbi:hypothetical protein ACTFIW_002466 [Dictyostelium discoideum]